MKPQVPKPKQIIKFLILNFWFLFNFYFKIGENHGLQAVDGTDINRLTRLWRVNKAKRKGPQALPVGIYLLNF